MINILGIVFCHVFELMENGEWILLSIIYPGVNGPEHVLGDTIGTLNDALFAWSLKWTLWLVTILGVLAHPGILLALVGLVFEDGNGVGSEVGGSVMFVVEVVFEVVFLNLAGLAEHGSFAGESGTVENVGAVVGGA